MYSPFSKPLGSFHVLFVLLISFGLLGNITILGKKSAPQEENLDFLDETPDEQTNQDECFELYGTVTKNADTITSKIQHICQVTDQQRIVRLDEVDSVIDWLNIAQLKNSEIKRAPTMPLSKSKLYSCLCAQNQLVKLLNECLCNSFRHLPDVNEIVDMAMETRSGSISTEKVHAQAALVKKNIGALTRSVEECGLTGFNKFYGKIVSPLIPWALIGGTTAGIAGTGYWLYNNGISEDTKWIGKEGLKQFSAHIVQSALMAAFSSIPLIYYWTAKKYSAIDSHLRGNKFKPTNEQVVVDDLDLDDLCFAHLREKLLPIYRMIEYIQNPQKFSLAGIKNYKAILLVGEPGSGKSYLARAIAGQLQKSIGHSVMISVTFDHYFEKGGIKKIVEDAKQQSGCVVLFLDEIHLYGVQAEKNVVGLQELLSCLDDLDRETDPQKQVFIIAATNRPDLIEDPLKRQGRFGTIIELTKPLYADRVNILETLCKKSAISPEEIQTERLARLTNGRPMSDLVSMFSQACFLAKSENKPVSFAHMYRALNLKLRGISEILMLKPEEVGIVSAHVAGKAIALLNLKTADHLDMITLYAEQKKVTARYDWQAKIKNDEAQFFKPDPGVIYTYEENELISGIGQTDKFAQVKILLAGLVAQRILFGSETSYHRADREQALEMALKIICGGIELKKLARSERDAILAEASAVIKTSEADVEKLLTENRPALEKLAKVLAERKLLRVEEIREIINN